MSSLRADEYEIYPSFKQQTSNGTSRQNSARRSKMNPLTRIQPMALLLVLVGLMATINSNQVSGSPLTALAPAEDNDMAAAELDELASLQEASNLAEAEVDEDEGESSSSNSNENLNQNNNDNNGLNNNNNQRWAENSESYEPNGQDSNIENAKIQLTATDMATAAGHYHHHGHYVSGKMSMGAHSGHKGAFGWHAKFPVGGKGRR